MQQGPTLAISSQALGCSWLDPAARSDVYAVCETSPLRRRSTTRNHEDRARRYSYREPASCSQGENAGWITDVHFTTGKACQSTLAAGPLCSLMQVSEASAVSQLRGRCRVGSANRKPRAVRGAPERQRCCQLATGPVSSAEGSDDPTRDQSRRQLGVRLHLYRFSGFQEPPTGCSITRRGSLREAARRADQVEKATRTAQTDEK
jgi:hypothetical protein